MYLWQRLATPRWFDDNAETLRSRLGDRLAIIERPNRKRLQAEAACGSLKDLRAITKEFGGRIKKLPGNWLHRFSRSQKGKPLKIGKRLIINVEGTSASRPLRNKGFPYRLIIPAGAAFGTGEHATTAMSLRLLERAFAVRGANAARVPAMAARHRKLRERYSAGRRTQHASRVRSPDLVVDLGTGSGILALAAKRLGAKRVIGIDLDPIAISTAKENARLNKIENVRFEHADVRRWKVPRHTDIVTANLFSELLMEIFPKLEQSSWLILSGVLREQEAQLTRALRRQKIKLVCVRRRGKWIAILARSNRASASSRRN